MDLQLAMMSKIERLWTDSVNVSQQSLIHALWYYQLRVQMIKLLLSSLM